MGKVENQGIHIRDDHGDGTDGGFAPARTGFMAAA
jgi:hypothetical protein